MRKAGETTRNESAMIFHKGEKVTARDDTVGGSRAEGRAVDWCRVSAKATAFL